MIELLEFEPSASGDDEGAADEETFAGAWEVTKEREEAVPIYGRCEGSVHSLDLWLTTPEILPSTHPHFPLCTPGFPPRFLCSPSNFSLLK